MKKYLQIILISFATFFVVANNVVLQYNDHICFGKMHCTDQTDDEHAKSEKANDQEENEKKQAFCYAQAFAHFTSTELTAKASHLNNEINQLPNIALDVELLPPNCLC